MNFLLLALFLIWYPSMCDGTLGSMVLFCSCLLSESIWQQTETTWNNLFKPCQFSDLLKVVNIKLILCFCHLVFWKIPCQPINQPFIHCYLWSDASPHHLQAFFYFKYFKYQEGSAFFRMNLFLVMYKAFGITICVLNLTTHRSICIVY